MKLIQCLILFLIIVTPSIAQNTTGSKNDSSKFIVISDAKPFNNLNDILELPQFNNKVILIDLWGYGCATCHKEFRNLKAIKEKYKNSPVEYLYIFLSNNIESAYWIKQEMYKFNLTGTHILADLHPDLTIFHGTIPEEFRNRKVIVLDKDEFAIPRFMIVDKKRNMAFFNAAKPSQKMILFNQIDEALKKQYD